MKAKCESIFKSKPHLRKLERGWDFKFGCPAPTVAEC